MSGDFFVLQCGKCNVWGVKEVRNLFSASFICKHCNKRVKVKNPKYGLNLLCAGVYKLPIQATNRCKDLNMCKQIK